MSNKTGDADTCHACGHSLDGHTEAPGLWCCFYDAARGRLCDCHGAPAPADNGPRIVLKGLRP